MLPVQTVRFCAQCPWPGCIGPPGPRSYVGGPAPRAWGGLLPGGFPRFRVRAPAASPEAVLAELLEDPCVAIRYQDLWLALAKSLVLKHFAHFDLIAESVSLAIDIPEGSSPQSGLKEPIVINCGA